MAIVPGLAVEGNHVFAISAVALEYEVRCLLGLGGYPQGSSAIEPIAWETL